MALRPVDPGTALLGLAAGGLSTSACLTIRPLGALLVLAPAVGVLLLFVLGTVVGAVASVLCGLDLRRESGRSQMAVSSIDPA